MTRISKKVVAVAPFQHPDNINFKMAAYEAWIKNGNTVALSHYPPRALHGAAFRWELPALHISSKEARLRFVEPVSISFDTFPDYAQYEIIPMIWDCWPGVFERTCVFFKSHKIRTAIFTSSQAADLMRKRFPDMNIFCITEGIDTSLYKVGKPLKSRNIDLLEFGRQNTHVLKLSLPKEINHVYSKNGEHLFATNEMLFDALSNTKITISLPRSVTQPEKAGNIETLTQRYWESMLSGILMVGHAPKELTEYIGYNPVVDIDYENANNQIRSILKDIEEYQPLVDRNRETAIEMGDWTLRMKQIKSFLEKCGYDVNDK